MTTASYNDCGMMDLRQSTLPKGLTLVMTDGQYGRQYTEVAKFSKFCPEHKGQGTLLKYKMYSENGPTLWQEGDDPNNMVELISVEVTPPSGSGRPDPYDYDCFMTTVTPEARKFFLEE